MRLVLVKELGQIYRLLSFVDVCMALCYVLCIDFVLWSFCLLMITILFIEHFLTKEVNALSDANSLTSGKN